MPQILDEHALVKALRLLDPLILFLTRATGQVAVSLPTLRRTLPQQKSVDADQVIKDLRALLDIGILHLYCDASTASDSINSWEDTQCQIGFPPPPSASCGEEIKHASAALHGTTKAAAKRRVAALKRFLKEGKLPDKERQPAPSEAGATPNKNLVHAQEEENQADDSDDDSGITDEERQAKRALLNLFGFTVENETDDRCALPTRFLPKQLAYAGSNPAQESVHAQLSPGTLNQIPSSLRKVFGLEPGCVGSRSLYRHQVVAIEAALNGKHCTVCTGTGSGKSLCFVLPVLTTAYNSNRTSIILFPTKALAQDQLSKITAILSQHPDLSERIRPATLDGDCPHSHRAMIAESANVILTNPDALHAAILPSWRQMYQSLLSRLAYIVIDEAHMYEGVFGAHVAMILSRLSRVCVAAAQSQGLGCRTPTFISASATLPWPESHFRMLCPVRDDDPVVVLSSHQDGAPRAAKHFFLHQPPVLRSDSTSTGKVAFPHPKRLAGDNNNPKQVGRKRSREGPSLPEIKSTPLLGREDVSAVSPEEMEPEHVLAQKPGHRTEPMLHRRHAADETALLLARAVANGVRCIAFCKTRNLVEWVYERTLSALKRDSSTAHLTSKIESYRGGYSVMERRSIERRLLFEQELLGVVATNALELGVDIGGMDLTLHCGYPSSYASLLQQAGRAGRGADRLGAPSFSVVVCFNSPSEQHLWRHPQSLLSKGVQAPHSIPFTGSLVQSHLVCASAEFPLTGELPVSHILDPTVDDTMICDHTLFGGRQIYEDALEELRSNGSLTEERVATSASQGSSVIVFKAHPSMKKAWARVSIRNIEPVSYSLVNASHPGQAGRMDSIHDCQAVVDTLPYSRVFFDAHPGAIVTHRGKRFKVVSMTRPPAFIPDNFSYRRSLCLAAFATPSSGDNYFTRPLSKQFFTMVKTVEKIEIHPSLAQENAGETANKTDGGEFAYTLAGCGAVNVKRTVHGYKKLSLITRAELSRSELLLPPIEFDTFGLWFDTEADYLIPLLGGDKYGAGVHALAHAILAVAPVLAPGIVRSDLECDHSFFEPRRVMLIDDRAGGSGSCQRLWSLFFRPTDNILEAAIQMLDCSSCKQEPGYDGGCPACLNAANCSSFNTHISRSAALVIGNRMLNRIKSTELYERNKTQSQEKQVLTPRRKARAKALRNAMGMVSAEEFVVGRPSWPLDN